MLAALHPALYVIRQTGLEPDDASRIVNFLLGHVMAGIEFQRERTQ
jgi:hypothetical protein